MAWTWHYQSADGTAMHPALGGQQFPNQSDAETWLGETWRELRDLDVAAVSLFEDGREVYGPMSLMEG